MIPPEWMHEANLALHRTLPYLLTLLSVAAAFELVPGSWRGQAGRLARALRPRPEWVATPSSEQPPSNP